MKFNNIVLCLVFALNILLFIFFLGFYPHNENLRLDYVGVIVATLALLVTVLIGWQIWTLIDMKGLKNEFKKEINYLHNKSDYTTALMYGRTSQMIASSICGVCREEIKNQMLMNGIISIKMLLNLHAEVEYKAILKTMLEALKATNDITLSEKNIENLILSIGEIKKRDEIYMIKDLIKEIQKCKKV